MPTSSTASAPAADPAIWAVMDEPGASGAPPVTADGRLDDAKRQRVTSPTQPSSSSFHRDVQEAFKVQNQSMQQLMSTVQLLAQSVSQLQQPPPTSASPTRRAEAAYACNRHLLDAE